MMTNSSGIAVPKEFLRIRFKPDRTKAGGVQRVAAMNYEELIRQVAVTGGTAQCLYPLACLLAA